MKPHQIITLMTFDGTDNTLSLPDHADHIHVGFRPLFGSNAKLGRQLDSVLKPGQWTKLIDRLGKIDNPTVLTSPSKYAIDARSRKDGRPATRTRAVGPAGAMGGRAGVPPSAPALRLRPVRVPVAARPGRRPLRRCAATPASRPRARARHARERRAPPLPAPRAAGRAASPPRRPCRRHGRRSSRPSRFADEAAAERLARRRRRARPRSPARCARSNAVLHLQRRGHGRPAPPRRPPASRRWPCGSASGRARRSPTGRWRRRSSCRPAGGTTGRPRRRDAALRPQERLAALLGGARRRAGLRGARAARARRRRRRAPARGRAPARAWRWRRAGRARALARPRRPRRAPRRARRAARAGRGGRHRRAVGRAGRRRGRRRDAGAGPPRGRAPRPHGARLRVSGPAGRIAAMARDRVPSTTA